MKSGSGVEVPNPVSVKRLEGMAGIRGEEMGEEWRAPLEAVELEAVPLLLLLLLLLAVAR